MIKVITGWQGFMAHVCQILGSISTKQCGHKMRTKFGVPGIIFGVYAWTSSSLYQRDVTRQTIVNTPLVLRYDMCTTLTRHCVIFTIMGILVATCDHLKSGHLILGPWPLLTTFCSWVPERFAVSTSVVGHWLTVCKVSQLSHGKPIWLFAARDCVQYRNKPLFRICLQVADILILFFFSFPLLPRPSILSSFHVAANQVVELADEVDPVLSFFSYQPLRATAKPGDSKYPSLQCQRTRIRSGKLVIWLTVCVPLYYLVQVHYCHEICNNRLPSTTRLRVLHTIHYILHFHTGRGAIFAHARLSHRSVLLWTSFL